MKEELKAIRCAIDGVADEMLEDRRHANIGDLVKIMKNSNENLHSITFALEDLVKEKKMQNEMTVTLR